MLGKERVARLTNDCYAVLPGGGGEVLPQILDRCVPQRVLSPDP